MKNKETKQKVIITRDDLDEYLLEKDMACDGFNRFDCHSNKELMEELKDDFELKEIGEPEETEEFELIKIKDSFFKCEIVDGEFFTELRIDWELMENRRNKKRKKSN